MKHQWYLTFHGGKGRSDLNSIHAYDADGKKIGKVLDRASLPATVELRELRGLAFGPDGELYLANAYKENSQILRFHGKRGRGGKHAFRDVFIKNDTSQNPGLSHPFNPVFDAHGDLFVTSQNTNLTLRYHGPMSAAGAGTPMPVAPALAATKTGQLMPGTFCAAANEVPDGLKVVRQAAFAAGLLCVADRDADCVRKYDPTTGASLGVIAAAGLIDKPIHLLVSDDALYIGNRGNESIVKCNLTTGQVGEFIRPKAGGLKNPSGLAIGGDGYFYVASRGTRQILRYQLSDAKPDRHPFIDKLEDEPEFIEPVYPS